MIVKDVRRYERIVLSTANFVRHIANESLNWVLFGILCKDKIIHERLLKYIVFFKDTVK